MSTNHLTGCELCDAHGPYPRDDLDETFAVWHRVGHEIRRGAGATWQGIRNHDREVAAKALREAAASVEEIDGRRDDAAAAWLNGRADRIERGEG